MKPKVVLLATGGTIASRYDPALGRTVASQRAEDLLEALPQVGEVAEIEIENFATIPSFDMSVQFAYRLARRVNEVLSRADVAGLVVTHGTDTMEETSYLADLLLASEKPAVFTGAQRAHDDPQSDGPFNLLNAVRVAAAPTARGLGAVICFNGTIHAARDVTKLHASAVETFQSLEHGALGEVDGDKVIIHRRPTLRRQFRVDRLEERVELIRLTLGIDLTAMESAVDRDVAGIVIEAFGRGNAPTRLSELVRRASDLGIPVLITSRCAAGRVQPIYGGGGGGRDLADAGGIFVGDLKGPKARLLLMVLLSSAETKARIAEMMAALAP
ncbi:MAG: asparaginase [Proteobacteria bacterium]|nr:MAG: asparaginase [Pseudomonadota bacterium]